MGSLELPGSELNGLRETSKRHHLRYRVDPALEMVGNGRVVIGYDVELIGAHPVHARVLPGCPHCKRIWDDLDRVAAAIRQRLEGRASVTRASQFNATLTSSRWPDGTPRDEVRLALSIRHRAGYFEPVDHCERKTV